MVNRQKQGEASFNKKWRQVCFKELDSWSNQQGCNKLKTATIHHRSNTRLGTPPSREAGRRQHPVALGLLEGVS